LSFPQAARRAVADGKPRSSVIDLAVPEAPPDLKARLADEKPKALEALLDDHGECAIPGATETVRVLAKAGVPMAVVTNSRAPHIWLRRVGLASEISVVITGDDVSSPKPSPEGYLLAAARLRVVPRDCLAIEDSRDGWIAATNAGMRVTIVAPERPPWLDANTERIKRLDAASILRMIIGS
jgi:HAD superfamily hydrolase (TIGR01509 family)